MLQPTIYNNYIYLSLAPLLKPLNDSRIGVLFEDMPLPMADLSKYPGLQCRPILFGFKDEEPRLLTSPNAAGPCLAYYRHVAIAAKKLVPSVEYVILGGHETFSAELSPLRCRFLDWISDVYGLKVMTGTRHLVGRRPSPSAPASWGR